VSRQNLGRLIFVVLVAAGLIAVYALGWFDDNAPPCSQGRVQVTCPATDTAR
jgi:hypothetical protein